jgi:hypothetical protein
MTAETIPPKNAAENLLTPEEVAAYLQVSPRTLESWRYKGIGPRFLRVTKRLIRYDLKDIRDWEKQSRKQSTSQY